jgi:hypothetical protein
VSRPLSLARLPAFFCSLFIHSTPNRPLPITTIDHSNSSTLSHTSPINLSRHQSIDANRTPSHPRSPSPSSLPSERRCLDLSPSLLQNLWRQVSSFCNRQPTNNDDAIAFQLKSAGWDATFSALPSRTQKSKVYNCCVAAHLCTPF